METKLTMSERDQLKELIYKEFPNGLKPLPGGYCRYIYSENDTLIYTSLTSGALGARFLIPNKYYDNAEEIYEDIKGYFNPNN